MWPLQWFASFVLTIAAAAAAFVLYQFVFLPSRNPLRKVPGPPFPQWIFASHLDQVLNAEKSAGAHEDLVACYGRNIHIKGIGIWDDRLLTLDPITVNYVLNNPSKFQKAWQSRRLITRLIGCGMLAAEGIVHKRQRKVSTPAFSPQNLKGFLPIYFAKADELCQKWKSILEITNQRMDVCHWISRATFDVIGLAGFGYEFHAIRDESNEVYLAYKEMFEMVISQGSNVKSILGIYFPIIWSLFPDDSTRIVDKSWKIILRVGRHLVQTKKLAIENGQTEDKDLLSLMLKSNLSSDIPVEQRISDDDLLFQISTFLFAGSDTTSLALTWTILILSQDRYRHFQDCLRKELQNVDSSAMPSVLFSDIDALPFLDNVVKESLRIVPPVHSSLRVATEDTVIPTSRPLPMRDGSYSPGVPVAKGSMIHIAVEGFALDREIWGPDAWEFKPSRWDNLPEPVKHQPGLYSNLLCFSAGPRSCIGMRFSIMEMKILLYSLITHFEFFDPENIFKANVVLTRPYIVGRFKDGSQCPIRIKLINPSSSTSASRS